MLGLNVFSPSQVFIRICSSDGGIRAALAQTLIIHIRDFYAAGFKKRRNALGDYIALEMYGARYPVLVDTMQFKYIA